MTEDWREGGFGLYIHWPFCEAKCPYCDFNSHVAREINQSAWRRAYLTEIDRVAALTPDRVLRSVFFGGGTPSLMAPETVDAILTRVREAWTQANDIEITLEANPGSVEAGRFRAYAQAGVNRVSMGVQAMNDDDLRRLGRLHTVQEAQSAFDIARACFERVSFDLIYARQDQSPEHWRAELTEALAMAVDHLSLYQLSIEPGTAFGDRFAKGKLKGLPIEDTAADMYELTQELCDAAGMPAYEVSNHAIPGAESRHNLIYWQAGNYAGIGPGAHGRLTLNGERHATEAWAQPGKWLNAVKDGAPEKVATPLSPNEQADEYLMMGLRVTDGIDIRRYAALRGAPLNSGVVSELTELGMICEEAGRLRATRQGRMVLNAIITRLLA
ncbi:coproporphyrinogen III oxidase [Roseovarius spongiae]|uniref:Heme chaperone HemW n=1 Tax=Roseovarius spongiae TaxID=2320272 RepID=A0A3A8ASL1_9RHOB|nr:radical SAM family heme chaperone HemW [Roseovarius spongiae]RKF13368.1 coproporphyrinogen III oxidase [Roseovarius spongiae]